MRLRKALIPALVTFRSLRTFGVLLLALSVTGVARADNSADQADLWVGRLGNPERVEQARDQLRELGERAVGALLRGLKSPDRNIRAESAFVLGRVGSSRGVEPLVQVLSDRVVIVREKAAYALGELADVRATSALIRLLEDRESSVRANAAFALGRIGSDKATSPLVLALRDRDVQVRNQAASALGFLNDKRVLGPLVWLLQNEKEVEVRALATSSLANLRDSRAVPTLVGLLEDPEMLVRARAIDGLYQLTGQRFNYDPRQTEAARAPAVARWKSWFARNRSKFGSVDPVDPETFKSAKPSPAEPKPAKPVSPEPVKPEPSKPEPSRPAPSEPAPVKPTPPQPKPMPPVPPPPRPIPPVPPLPQPIPPLPPAPQPEVPDSTGLIPVPVITPVIAGPVRSDALSPDTPQEVLDSFKHALQLYDAGKLTAAAEEFQTLVDKSQGSVPLIYDLGLTQQRLGLAEAASKTFEAVLALAPAHRQTLNNLGVLHRQADQSASADDCFRRALKADSDHPDLLACYNLADLLFGKGSYEQALTCYELLWDHHDRLDESISSSALHLRRMQCNLSLDRTEDLNKLFALEGPPPDDPGLLRAYAWYRFAQTDYPGALRSLNRALRVARDDPENVDSLARFYLQVPDQVVRNPFEASVLAEQAVRANPRQGRYWWTLLDASLACQRTVRAVQALAAIADLDAVGNQGGP